MPDAVCDGGQPQAGQSALSDPPSPRYRAAEPIPPPKPPTDDLTKP
ncbi:hypothetical protein [Kitasatospora sp. NPDC001683]